MRASRAKFGKTLLGGFQVIYRCPHCKQELTTKNDAVMKGDSCPHCNVDFVFDVQIQGAFADLVAKKASREESKQAEQAEKERIRDARRQEEARLAAESEEQHQREIEQARARRAEQVAGRPKQQLHGIDARDISEPYGCLKFIFIVAVAAIALVLFGAFVVLNSNYAKPDEKSAAFVSIISVVSAALSVAVVYLLFRVLWAIHALLVQILDRLDSRSGPS